MHWCCDTGVLHVFGANCPGRNGLFVTKEVMTFRVSDEIQSKLTHLMQLDQETAVKLNRKPKGKSEIITDAIESYYLSVLADNCNDPYMQRLEIVFERVFRKYMSGFIRSLNATNILARESKEYMRLLCKGLNIDRAMDGVERLLYMTLPWDILIPEKIAREMRVKNPEAEDEELM